MTYTVTFRLYTSGKLHTVEVENAESLDGAVLAARRTCSAVNHGNAELVQVYRKLEDAA